MNQYTRRAAQRESFDAVAETCPKLDEIMAEATEAIRSLTVSLRDALTDAIHEKIDFEAERDELRERVRELEDEIAALRSER